MCHPTRLPRPPLRSKTSYYLSIRQREGGKNYTPFLQEAVIRLRIEYLCQRTRQDPRLSHSVLSTQLVQTDSHLVPDDITHLGAH